MPERGARTRANEGARQQQAPLHSRPTQNTGRDSTMAAYILRRLWQMVPTILGVVLLVLA